MYICMYTHTHTHRHTNTHRNTDTDTDTDRQTDRQTHKHTHTQTHIERERGREGEDLHARRESSGNGHGDFVEPTWQIEEDMELVLAYARRSCDTLVVVGVIRALFAALYLHKPE